MLRLTVVGVCLLLVLVAVCNAAPNPEGESEDLSELLLRERRTYGHYRPRNCGKPGAPTNGWAIFRATTAGNKVLHSCKAGYLLVGAKLRICQSNGRWTPSLPHCRLIDCGDPGEPANGKKWLGSTTLGSYVKYKCMEGFQLSGYKYRKCLSSGVWSGRLPSCEPVGCPMLSDPRNGNVEVSQKSGRIIATYSCNRGFLLRGSATRQCIRGKWQGEEPICQVIDCGSLSPPANGVVLFDRTTYEATARYRCNRGFRLQGTETRTCQLNGRWSSAPPTCEVIECPRLANIANGAVLVKRRTVGSTATYRCNDGYNLQGNRQRVCQANGQWSGEEPSCQVIECPVLSNIANGAVLVKRRTVGSTASYRCNDGYRLQGNRQRVCQGNGQWSGEEPSCQVIECPVLSNIANGAVVVTRRTVGSTATYRCNDGYRLQGNRQRVCQGNGQWSGEEPSCQVIECPVLSNIANGAVVVTRRTVGSTATYRCNDGYRLQGNRQRVCQGNGQWSGEEPSCEVNECPELPDIANGAVVVTRRTVGSTATYRCNDGYRLQGNRQRVCQANGQWSGREPSCQVIECPQLADIANGAVAVNSRTVGSTASYRCIDGYRLQGNRQRVCQGNGQWSGEEPSCQVIECPELADIANGAVVVTSRTVGSTATYRCIDGYRLQGNRQRVCQGNGQWSGEEPSCEVIECPELADIANGAVIVTIRTVGSTASYRCNAGYRLQGNRQRVCQGNGQWSGEEPSCQVIECPQLADIANGAVAVNSRTVGSTATYSCIDGYRLQGNRQRVCQGNGQWSGEEPFCQVVECPNLPNPENGQVSISGFIPASQASYTCDTGFFLRGVTVRVCLDSGDWSFEAPICEQITCPGLENPANGVVNVPDNTPFSTATYICNSGYELLGVQFRTCQLNGTWSDQAPICIESLCPALTAPPNGQVSVLSQTVDSIATYSCNSGFSLVGNTTRTCIDRGEGVIVWTGQEPRCVPIRCPRLFSPANGQVIAPLRTVGSQASYSCNRGYTIQGQQTRVCQSNSEWSGEEPVCIVVDCGSLRDIPNGRVELTTTTFGSTAEYVCDPGFSIVGASLRTCLDVGVWSGREPICTPSMCGQLNNPVNGQVTISGSSIGATATYTCNRGYVLRGVVSRVCQTDGQWSGAPPVCEAIECSDLDDPANGNVELSGFVYTSTATYSCNPGYVLVGVVTRTCQDDGFWSGVPPVCQPVQCDVLDFPDNGQVIQLGNDVGTRATYTCFPGYIISGQRVRTCESNGEWSGTPPICTPIDCGDLPQVDFGFISFSQSTTFGSQATYSCQDGYVLMGVQVRTCQIDGTWSGEAPTCQIFTCGSLDNPDNGQVFINGFEVGNTATYVCDEGFDLQGESMRECQRNGQWSGRPPVCIGITCPILAAPDNGQVVVRGVTVGSTARYSCLPGYVLEGATEVTCLSSGEWDDEEPVCVDVFCPDLPDPANGEVVLSGNTFGSTASYRCNIGYGLVGVSIRVCQADGFWSEEAPICEISTCSTLEPPQNGNIMTTSTQFGGTATYTCNVGYRLEGDSVRTCQATGFWSGRAPFCTIVMCPLLRPPKDGRVIFSSTTYQAVAEYECFPGYRLEGVEERVCQANGEWSDEKPFCQRIDCGLLEIPKNGDIAFSQGTLFRSVATYSCDSPFQLVGSVTRVCQSNMEWSGEAPVCETILCEELDSPDNGAVVVPNRISGSVATYSCDEGYNLIGSRTRNCQTNGFWTGVVPICQLSDCGSLKPPRNGDVELSGTTIGSIATYECFDGYVLEGDEIRSCVDGGVWTGIEPVCNLIDCGRLDNITYGFVEFDGTLFGSTASYSCNSGFVLMGKGIRQCMEDGVWSGDEPVCQEVDCGTLPNPQNGDVILSGTSFGFTATYNCDDGYTIIGAVTRICQITGEWSEEEPVCVVNQCPELDDPLSGSVTLSGRDFLDTATYSCNQGYVVSGDAVRVCQANFFWSGVAPTCIRSDPQTADCGLPPFLLNGEFTLSSGTVEGSRATYSCFRGYILVGSTFRFCLSTGEWSQESISCQIIDCGEPPSTNNGEVVYTSTVIDSQARYSCDSGFDLVGVEIRICQDNGWSNTVPSCVPTQVFTCDQLPAPANGGISVTGFTAGSFATYSCNDGYILSGEAVRQCLEPLGWSGFAPTCRPVDCGILQPPSNGQVMMIGTALGSRAMYNCNQGYILLGSVTRTCERNGRWSGEEPICSAVECGGLPNPVNGFVSVTGVTLGSVATYTCQTGYSLIGSTTRQCGRSGRWTGVAPTCERSTPTNCGDPGTPEFGSRIGNDFRVGATVYFECDSGYRLDGPGSRQCQSSGLWTGNQPQCVEVTETCQEGATVYDDCRRRCTCSGGLLVDCCRVRFDFASLSTDERQRYIQTVLTVATDDKYQPRYEALITQYTSSFDTTAQDTDPAVSQFFPWNRYFLLQYENLLQEVDCRVTIPYWDWTPLPMSPYLAVVWNPDSGFGDSARSKDNCVENGPFRFDQFEIVGGGCLQRNYRMQMFPTRAIVEQDLLTLPAAEYSQFHRFLQIFIHTNVRCFVGGQMCSNDAANDPAYILHLAQIDTIFSRWQNIDSDRASVLDDDNRELVLSSGNLVVSDFADITDLPGTNSICYEPAEFKTHVPPSMKFLTHSLERMTNDDSMHMTCVSDSAMSNVGMSPAATDFMHSMCGDN